MAGKCPTCGAQVVKTTKGFRTNICICGHSEKLHHVPNCYHEYLDDTWCKRCNCGKYQTRKDK